MQIEKWGVALLPLLFCVWKINAQGPPITSGKPIMLGANSKVLKTLTELRSTQIGTFVKVPFMVHYLPTSNTLVGAHIPLVRYNFIDSEARQTLGDVELLAKYQFFRKDKMGKTFRMVVKTLQTLPTGKPLGLEGISTNKYQSYLGIVAGYESIKYGISNELGYNLLPSGNLDELRYKLGFGLPLLKQTYPVNQINLYFEYQNSWFVTMNEFLMLYAQGVQYAKGRLTVEGAVQFPLVHTTSSEKQRIVSVFLGTRYVF